MKKSALLFAICMVFVGCSKSPGSKEMGYQGIPWGADVATVAKKLNVAPNLTSADSLFGTYYQGSAPRLAVLLKKGFSKLLTGQGDADLNGVTALKEISILNEGKAGYSLFFNKKFGMALDTIPTKEYQDYHSKLMKKYGLIDKKLEYRANEYESSYLVMWHNADGFIILAKETYNADPTHRLTSTQIIHMDKKIFVTISGELSKTEKTG